MYLTSTAIADFDGDNDLDIIMVGLNNTTTAFKTRTFINNSTITSVNENVMNLDISVYPNPSNDLIHINLIEGQLKRLDVYRMNGNQIYKTTISSNQYNLNICAYPAGTYFLRIENQDFKIATLKIVKK